ncbi:hypothetical protein CROQUDRAFT_52860, partial [Cronartium quercuum f. sp. fusiforme G11]
QAAHFLKFGALILLEAEMGAAHPSMLENKLLSAELMTWATLQKPGEAFHKSLYFNGHEQEDVKTDQKTYKEKVAELCKHSQSYVGKNLEDLVLVHPDVLSTHQETVFVYHNEPMVHAKEQPRLSGLLSGVSELRSKKLRLEMRDKKNQEKQRDMRKLNLTYLTEKQGIEYCSVLFQSWWDMNQLINQIVPWLTLPIFKVLHPNCQGVFIFDCSSAPKAYGPLALQVQNMNLGPGGKQGHLQNTVNPELSGQPKGIQVVLEECGLWDFHTKRRKASSHPPLLSKCTSCKSSLENQQARQQAIHSMKEAEMHGLFLTEEQCGVTPQHDPGSSDCCWSKILGLQSNFASENPLLQMVIEEAGHICLFLPTFHCELNPIEIFWAYIKSGMSSCPS